MQDYDLHHHLVVLSEDELSGLRGLVGICFGVALHSVDSDPMTPLLDELVLQQEPVWPDQLATETQRLEFLFNDVQSLDEGARQDEVEITPILGADFASFGSKEEEPESDVQTPGGKQEPLKSLDLIISLPGDLSDLLPALGQSSPEISLPVLKRMLRWLPFRQPEVEAEKSAVRIRITAYYGSNLVLSPGLEPLMDTIRKANSQDGAKPEKTGGDPSSTSGVYDDAGLTIENDAGVSPALSDSGSTTEPDKAIENEPAKNPDTGDAEIAGKPQTVSFLVLHSLAADPVIPVSMSLAKKLDEIQAVQAGFKDDNVVSSGVVTCCLTDTLVLASRINNANTIQDAVALLLQEVDNQNVWMKSAWVDIFGTVYSEEYRNIIARHWENQKPADHKAMKKLSGADLSLLMVDCDFGGLDLDALEIAYLHTTPRRLNADFAGEPAIQGSAKIEHMLFGAAALKLAKLQLGTHDRAALYNSLKARWRPYRSAAVLLACLSGNNNAAAQLWHEQRIAGTVYGRFAQLPATSSTGS